MFLFALKRWMKAGREVLWGLFFDWLLITAAVLGEEFQSRLTTGWIFITVHRGSSRPIQSRFQKTTKNICFIMFNIFRVVYKSCQQYCHLSSFMHLLVHFVRDKEMTSATFYIWLKTIPVQLLGIDNPKMQNLVFSSPSIESLQINA